MAEYTPIGFRGLDEYAERHFVDRKPYLPPSHQDPRISGDPFWKATRTYSDVATEEALATPSGVSKPGVEPGASEFSYGRGLMCPLGLGPGPTAVEEMKAIMRTNPADAEAAHEDRYADWIRE